MLGGVYFALYPDRIDQTLTSLDEDFFFSRIVGSLLLFFYYFGVETLLGGKSLGKFVTKTRVVDYEGRVPSPNTFFVRSISRIVPFEIFSFLGQRKDGWHDRWSKTMVIDEQKSRW